MPKQVLRNSENGITHVYVCTEYGAHYYVPKEKQDTLMLFSSDDVNQYFSGEDHDEIDSLKESLSKVLTGEAEINQLKLSILISNGKINNKEILKIAGD